MQDVELTWSERVRKEEREEGVVEGKRQMLLRQLAAKFGTVSDVAKAQIDALSASELDACSVRVLSAETLGDVFD